MKTHVVASALAFLTFSATTYAAGTEAPQTTEYTPLPSLQPMIKQDVASSDIVSDKSTLTQTPEVTFDTQTRYFIGLTGGASHMSMTARTINLKPELGNKFSNPKAKVFYGGDIGFYTAGGHSRVYYSYQKHTAESTFNGKNELENDVSFHLLSADYIFFADRSINPFVGAHIGYMTLKQQGAKYGSHDVTGQVLGIQAGVAWRMTNHLTAELGVRHSGTQSEEIEPWASNKIATQLKSITSGYMSVNYRF